MATGNDILIRIRADNDQIKAKLDELINKTSKTTDVMGGMFKKIAALAGTYLGIETFNELKKLAGEVDTVSKTFASLAQGAEGGANGLLQAMKEATMGTVSYLDMMKSANLAVNLLGEEALKNLPEMAKIARAAAMAQGKDVKDMLNDIVVASGRQSVLILDNLGISSAIAANKMEEYARKLGKTRDELTTTEKKAAFFYATMEAGRAIMNKLDMSQLTFGERLQRTRANMDNMKAMISQQMIPGLEAFSDAMNSAKEGSDSFAASIGKVISSVLFLAGFLITGIKQKIAEIKMHFTKSIGDIQEFFSRIAFDLAKMFEVLGKQDLANKMKEQGEQLLYSSMVMKQKSDAAIGEINKLNEESAKMFDNLVKMWATDAKLVTETNKKMTKTITQDFTNLQLKMSELFGYLGQRLLSELAREDETYKEMLKKYANFQGMKEMLTEAHNQRVNEIKMKFDAEYYEYVNRMEEAALLKEQIKYQEIQRSQKFTYEQDAAMKVAYENKKTLAAANAGKERQKQDVDYLQAKLKILSAEWEAFREITNYSTTLMRSKNKVLFAMGKALAYAQAVMNAAQAVTKIWAQWGWPLGAIFSGIAIAATGVEIGTIQKTKLPSYRKGRVPVLQEGFVPADHFPAFIGTKEAVINAESTRANRELLREMNANPGKTVEGSGGVTVQQNNTFSGNVLSNDFIDQVVTKRLEELARYQGTTLFAKQGKA